MVFITGDTHGRFDRFDHDRVFLKNHFTREDYVVICGDFGGVWYSDYWHEKKLDHLAELPFTILFADGNHENYDLLETYPTVDWHGGKVRFIRENVLHLMRGQIYNIEWKSYFVMGGAACHDTQDGILDPSSPHFKDDYVRLRKRRAKFRVKGISWWPQELPSKYELVESWDALCARGKKVDVVISHCAPTCIQKEIVRKLRNNSYKENALTDFLQQVYDECEFKAWYCGHYHREMCFGKLHVLYKEIKRVSFEQDITAYQRENDRI